MEGNPRITKSTLEVLSSFVTVHICAQAFSILVDDETQNGTGFFVNMTRVLFFLEQSHESLVLSPKNKNRK